jgi:CMP-N,N'-diacetyllegionaminic acid synthase
MKSVCAIIPARSGSKGVVDKNIRLLNGKPLIAYSILAALKSDNIDRVIVSTDSEQYAKISIDFGAEVPFIRPERISGDSSTDIEFLLHAIDWLEVDEGYKPDFISLLRPTTPLRDPKIIDEAIQSFINSDFTALRSVHKMSQSSYKTFEIENEKLKKICNSGFNIETANRPRQEFPETFDPNGYIDIIRTDLVKNESLVHGNNVKAFITEQSYEIDEINDIDFLEFMSSKHNDLINNLFN